MTYQPQRGERKMVKMCRCQSTSSGPRYVIRSKTPDWENEKHIIEVTAELIEFGCDDCDTPWLDKREV